MRSGCFLLIQATLYQGVKVENEEDVRVYKVVVNHEEQYSIWFADRECPLGWREEGKVGSKSECIEHIDQVWVDMRPLSLRKAMETEAGLPA